MNEQTQIKILDTLAKGDTKKGMQTGEIARALRRTPIAIYSELLELQDRGLIESRLENDKFPSDRGMVTITSPDKRRLRYYRLTPRGNADTPKPRR